MADVLIEAKIRKGRRKNCQQAELHYERPSAKHQNTHLPREILRFLQKPIEFRRFFQAELQQFHSPAAQNSNNFLELLTKSVEKKRQDENLKSQLNTSELIRQMSLKSMKKKCSCSKLCSEKMCDAKTKIKVKRVRKERQCQIEIEMGSI